MSSAGGPTPTPPESADESRDTVDGQETTEGSPRRRPSAGRGDSSGRGRRGGPAEPTGDGEAEVEAATDAAPPGAEAETETEAAVGGKADGRPEGGDGAAASAAVSPETVAEIEAAAAIVERDELRDALSRIQAEFENFKKRMLRQQSEHTERAAEQLVTKLLPVLDAIDLALAHHDAGSDAGRDIASVAAALGGVLGDEGLERVDPKGSPFDPSQAEAVAHEASSDDDESDGPVVSEVLRAGYRWRGRVVRPAMVKVRG